MRCTSLFTLFRRRTPVAVTFGIELFSFPFFFLLLLSRLCATLFSLEVSPLFSGSSCFSARLTGGRGPMSADAFACGIAQCQRATASGCTGDNPPACRCRIGSQYGAECDDNRWIENPSIFYGYYATMLVLFAALTAFGTFIFYFYLAKFRPRLPQKPRLLNPHFIAIFAISLGCFFRLIYSIVSLAAGPRVEV